jgi:hypothetical protein
MRLYSNGSRACIIQDSLLKSVFFLFFFWKKKPARRHWLIILAYWIDKRTLLFFFFFEAENNCDAHRSSSCDIITAWFDFQSSLSSTCRKRYTSLFFFMVFRLDTNRCIINVYRKDLTSEKWWSIEYIHHHYHEWTTRGILSTYL